VYIAEQDAKQRACYQESLKRKKGSKSSRNHEENTSRLKATQAAKKAADPNTVKEMQKELATQVHADLDLPMPEMPHRAHVPRPSALVSRSHIATTRLGRSASSKLDFIIDEVSCDLFSNPSPDRTCRF
jgi:hypothetical protein